MNFTTQHALPVASPWNKARSTSHTCAPPGKSIQTLDTPGLQVGTDGQPPSPARETAASPVTTLLALGGAYLLDQERFLVAIIFPAISHPDFCHFLLQGVLESFYVRQQGQARGVPSPTE